MANPAQQVALPATPFRRTYPLVDHKTSGTGSLQLYRGDAVTKRFLIRATGSIQLTYASGTPISSPNGLFSLIERFEVAYTTARGQRLVKSITPQMAQRLQLLATGNFPERKGQAAAAPVVAPN